MISIIARETGAQRFWGCDRANQCPCSSLIAKNVPGDSAILYTDAWQSYRGRHTAHATDAHGGREWARDDDGDGQREVHGNTCEGAGAALRTYLRGFRGVHKQYLHLYVVTYGAMVNAKRVTPELIQRMCAGNRSAHTSYT
jgi:transposase-like protein